LIIFWADNFLGIQYHSKKTLQFQIPDSLGADAVSPSPVGKHPISFSLNRR
jgi:hypothetical protein